MTTIKVEASGIKTVHLDRRMILGDNNNELYYYDRKLHEGWEAGHTWEF